MESFPKTWPVKQKLKK